MPGARDEKRWFWATLMLSSISIVAIVFAFWELVENHFFRDANYVSLHYLYISRGIASSLLLSVWAAWFVLQQRRKAEDQLRRQRERYRGLLNTSPAAVTLFDAALRLSEWNSAAEKLYGYKRGEVLGKPLPTVPPDKESELHDMMARVEAGEAVLDSESVRRDRDGNGIQVQVSLLPFRDREEEFFLEVTSDLRERVRLRQMLLEVEKLTSMGKMAAGTAHHLNTPLASMLLRVQMMRDRFAEDAAASDLERLEKSIVFCQQFVRRLLDFTRLPKAQRQPEEMTSIVEAVLGFVGPSLQAKRAVVSLDLQGAMGQLVLGDRNQLETVLLTLISNALDAIPEGGRIAIRCRPAKDGMLELEVNDSGCGISATDLPHLFEPFFTTKPPGRGTGLGLPIAQNIVNEHGGTIELESEEGVGTTARVLMPVCNPVRTEVQA